MDRSEGSQRNSRSSCSGSDSSSFLAEREERVRARTQARTHASYEEEMREIVAGAHAISMFLNDSPRSTPSRLQQSQQMQQQAASPFSVNHSSMSEERQQMTEGGYRDAFSSYSRHYYSPTDGRQQMAKDGFVHDTSPFPLNYSLNGGRQQMAEGGFGRSENNSFSHNYSLSQSGHQMAEGGFGQATSPFNYSHEEARMLMNESGFGYSFARDEISIAESLRSPGQFGSSADWTPTRPPRDLTPAARHTDLPTSIEFVPILPPSSLPMTFSRPRTRGEGLILSSATSRQQPLRVAPQSLLQLQMIRGGSGVAGVLYAGSVLDVSCRTGRNFAVTAPSVHPFINSLPPHVRAQWQLEQRAPPARRARPSSGSSQHRRNSSSSNEGSMGSSRGSSGNATECNYCLSVGLPNHGHNKYNCPVLAGLPPCLICGATGKDNHTESHCPRMEKVELDFVPRDQRRRSLTI